MIIIKQELLGDYYTKNVDSSTSSVFAVGRMQQLRVRPGAHREVRGPGQRLFPGGFILDLGGMSHNK